MPATVASSQVSASKCLMSRADVLVDSSPCRHGSHSTRETVGSGSSKPPSNRGVEVISEILGFLVVWPSEDASYSSRPRRGLNVNAMCMSLT